MSAQKTFALVLGIILLIVGIAGFLPNGLGIVRDGIFGTNATHDVLHIIAGLFGIYVGTKGQGPGYNRTIGWIGILLFVLGIIPGIGLGADSLLAQWLNVNMAISILHLAIGVVALWVGYKASA